MSQSSVSNLAPSAVFHAAFALLLSWPPQLSRGFPADAGFLCNETAVLGAAIKEGSCRCMLLTLSSVFVCVCVCVTEREREKEGRETYQFCGLSSTFLPKNRLFSAPQSYSSFVKTELESRR